MAEFTPINTQEELNAVIGGRLASQEKKIREEYADYEDLKKQSAAWETDKQAYEKTIADNKTAFDELTQQLTEATGKIAQYETDALKTKIAIEAGLPVGLFSYLKGNTEEEIKQSAEELGKYAKAGQRQPLADPEGDEPKGNYSLPGQVNPDRAMKKFMETLKIINE